MVECACIVELKALGGVERLNAKYPSVKVLFRNITLGLSYFRKIGLEFD